MNDIAFRTSTSVSVHAINGATLRHSNQIDGAGAGIVRSQSTAPYVGRGNKCSANGDTCEGYRVKGAELCAGHLRSEAKNS